MTPRDGSWSIVLVGHWNRMIFTPQWVGQQLFDQDEVMTRVPFGPDMPIFYLTDEIELGVASGRLFVKPRKLVRGAMQAVESMACGVLDRLPHTPVTGVGVNYGFDEAQAPDTVNRLFTMADRVEIDSLGWEVPSISIKRTLVKDDQLLNLTFLRSNETTSIEANFHADVGSAEAARQAICGRTYELFEMLAELLQSTHGIELPREEDANE